MKEPCVFLSYVHADQSWAERFSSLLAGSGITICNSWSSLKPGEDFEARLRESIGTATHTVVLIGPQTRFSHWVDREIEHSTESREDAPGAALIGVILPSHEDFSRPYYDPENVPLRLHDSIQNDYAIAKKWSEDPAEIGRWLDEAEKRRHRYSPEPSLGAAAQLYRFSWDEAVDAPRAPLKKP
jgi:hypothetical protein